MKGKFDLSLAIKTTATFATLLLFIVFLVAFAVRQLLVDRLTSHHRQAVASTSHAIQQNLAARRAAIGNQLQQFAAMLKEKDGLRSYAIAPKEHQQDWMLNEAQNWRPALKLQALEITDQRGVVLSPGHDCSLVGKEAGRLIHRLRASGSEPALTWFRCTHGPSLCLTALDSVQLSSNNFYLLGGVEITSQFLLELLPDTTQTLMLQLSDHIISSAPQWRQTVEWKQRHSGDLETALPRTLAEHYFVGEFTLPAVVENSNARANIFLLYPKTELVHLLSEINVRIFIIAAIGMIFAIFLSVWRARALAKSLHRLATIASDLSLDSLEVEFDAAGKDEVGVLNNALQKMVRRLRQSRIELAGAEKKAALAELARQVHHDITNGFLPIRMAMQHWVEVADHESEKLVKIFNERKLTVLESLDYLENLTRNYLRLRINVTLSEVNVNELVQELLRSYQDLPHRDIQFQTRLDPRDPRVHANAMMLRRAFESILHNAIEAVTEGGAISVCTEVKSNQVVIHWKDTGAGIPEDIRQRLFQAHVTTKPEGSGFGLVNVKRTIEDFGGSVMIESEVGKGTIVRLALPHTNGAAT
ncbi:MAG: ATP-binding protein [bacterium]